MDDRQIHDRGNGTYDADRLLAARTAALREAVRLELGLAGAGLGNGLTVAEADHARAVIETTAARLERWILRPVVDPEAEAVEWVKFR
jgi:hypothetical protein